MRGNTIKYVGEIVKVFSILTRGLELSIGNELSIENAAVLCGRVLQSLSRLE